MPANDALEIKVVPRSSKSRITVLQDGTVKMNIKSPPVDGKANGECVAVLSKKLGVPKSSVHIIHGEKGRNKKIRVDGMSASDMYKILLNE